LRLEPGILGLLGPNGAGKSTLMRMLATVTKPTSGTIRFNGSDVTASPDALRRTLGYLPQDFGIYPHLTAVEFLEYIGALKGIPRRALRARIDALLDALNLTQVRSRALGGFSGGMRQRVGIAQALLNDPRLLIVDEPTAGLDPEERQRLRTLLRQMAGDRIIIFSTHICSDVESIATRVAVVAGGALLAYDRPSTLVLGRSSLEEAYFQIVNGARAAA
jgi:ABC-2 type transport system ATP-binding protein